MSEFSDHAEHRVRRLKAGEHAVRRLAHLNHIPADVTEAAVHRLRSRKRANDRLIVQSDVRFVATQSRLECLEGNSGASSAS